MQLVKDGPDVPESLIQAHEDGRVVFFCGAGISYPAGLPDFSGLVERIYGCLGTKRTAIEQQSFDRYQYDATIDALERRYPGQRTAVRRALTTVLKPNLKLKGAWATHSALIELSKDRKGAVRLVTTNFDRLFEYALRRNKLSVPSYPAPLLPIPKSSRWNGVVYLHGLISGKGGDSELQRLVLSSGDFGLAYLTERWAARFVSELFRNYVVCFVGYSINDPVLRYMMDALAADRMLGESTLDAYAFGSFQAGEEGQKLIEWGAKGVTPILYEVPKGTHDHSALHQTIQSWAHTYRDGVLGRERIVVQHATSRPLASTKQDDFVGRMLWALTHETGLPAKRFAEFNPVPPLEWLEPLCDQRYGHVDLVRFGVPPLSIVDPKLAFSLAFRPAPYTRAPLMALLDIGSQGSGWDQVMYQLARWLARHLDDPALIWWLTDRGGKLSTILADILDREIERIGALEKNGQTIELDAIRAGAPRGVPRAHMRTLWNLIINGRTKTSRSTLNLFRWKERLNREGLTASVRLQLRELLAPQVALGRPFNWSAAEDSESRPPRLRDLVNWEMRLASDDASSVFADFSTTPSWELALPALIEDFETLVRDALDLMRELGDANELTDRSFWDLPSIKPHWQNRGYRDWVVLVELLRASWLALLGSDLTRAQKVANDWWIQGYPLFRRLALFAATYEGVSPNEDWVTWLISEDGWWLWASDTQREVLRLFVERGAKIGPGPQSSLESAILSGLPRERFRLEISPEDWKRIADRAMWLRLAKLKRGGLSLGPRAGEKLAELESNNPIWKVAANERDEFSHWTSGTGDPDFESEVNKVEQVPQDPQQLVQWLRNPVDPNAWRNDNWRDVCRQEFSLAANALIDLAQREEWPTSSWEVALQAWVDSEFLQKSWERISPVLLKAPDQVLVAIAHAATWWLEAVSKLQIDVGETLWALCRRMLGLDYSGGMLNENPVMQAINHPIGHLTQAVLNRWFQSAPEDRQQLPPRLRELFSEFCDLSIEKFRHSRVLLSANVITIFRVDPNWAMSSLIPIFSWRISESEALGAWDGFLWSPRLYRPLFAEFKDSFLDTAKHYEELGESGRQYAAILTFAALDSGDTFTREELREATESLPRDGLIQCADALARAQEGSEAQREEQWRNRVLKYLQSVWPKDVARRSPGISEALARLAVETGNSFGEAVTTLEPWLEPIAYPHAVIRRMVERKLASAFPREALSLLDKVIGDASWTHTELSDCLRQISENLAQAAADPRYRRLDALARQRGG